MRLDNRKLVSSEWIGKSYCWMFWEDCIADLCEGDKDECAVWYSHHWQILVSACWQADSS